MAEKTKQNREAENWETPVKKPENWETPGEEARNWETPGEEARNTKAVQLESYFSSRSLNAFRRKN